MNEGNPQRAEVAAMFALPTFTSHEDVVTGTVIGDDRCPRFCLVESEGEFYAVVEEKPTSLILAKLDPTKLVSSTDDLDWELRPARVYRGESAPLSEVRGRLHCPSPE